MILYTLLSRSGSRIASAVIGILLVGTGGYFLLRNAGLIMAPIDWDLVWPLVVIASGVAIASRAVPSVSTGASGTQHAPQPDPAETGSSENPPSWWTPAPPPGPGTRGHERTGPGTPGAPPA